LGIHSLLKKQPLKHNVIDRDKVVIPPNWDSWGKIRVLRDGFDVDLVSNGWSIDLDQPFPHPHPNGNEAEGGESNNVSVEHEVADETLTEHGELTTISIRRVTVFLLRRRAVLRGLDASAIGIVAVPVQILGVSFVIHDYRPVVSEVDRLSVARCGARSRS
jgi:hypothetical protein